LPERATTQTLTAIKGVVPGQFDRPRGCLFNPRCDFATDLCRTQEPTMNNGVLCHYPLGGK
jgi:dipeptide transport system ATP-binding protein